LPAVPPPSVPEVNRDVHPVGVATVVVSGLATMIA
jgi:hypothetical protein